MALCLLVGIRQKIQAINWENQFDRHQTIALHHTLQSIEYTQCHTCITIVYVRTYNLVWHICLRKLKAGQCSFNLNQFEKVR